MATRMVCTLFVLLAVLAVGTAQKGCCFPDQYVSNSGGLIYTTYTSGRPVINTSYFYGQTAVDVPNNQKATIQVFAAGQKIYIQRNIWDYNKKTLYSIVNNGTGCITQSLEDTKLVHCIPDNAGFQGNGYLADHKLSIRSWTYDSSFVSPIPYSVNTTLVVSTDECIPLSSTAETTLTGSDTSTVVVTAFTNYTKGNADPAKFFNIPKFCSKDFHRGIPDENILAGAWMF